ncbi:MAG: hypothetical protein HeimC2_06490 [Candidatus Heimdallarchaeota archaeon LC_2]|nr:MAG: hypothetical protein HeimC2_06490 [Candidatus Heimdallarchaeota archaeon LC_2]
MSNSETKEVTHITDQIGKIESNSLDRFIQVLEISFVFLVVYSLITLFDAALDSFELYQPISDNFLGEDGVGSLRGGQWEAIVRVTVVFNLLLFGFSLFFGMWMRKTRDGWTFNQLGFTFRTPNYSFKNIVQRGLILGFLVIVIQYTIMTMVMWYDTGNFSKAVLNVHTFFQDDENRLFTGKELQAEYYFGFIEMGIIWPLSAGFFFFAYTHNSLAIKFNRGMANLLSSLFYVYYLLIFFMLPNPGKLEQIFDSKTWTIGLISQMIVFFLILYISFSAFAETKSVVLPFLLNFVLNVVLTAFKAFNSIVYDEYTPLMLLPYLISIIILIIYYFYRREVYSTIKNGWNDIKSIKVPITQAIGYSVLFISLSFMVPGLLEYVIANHSTDDFILPVVTSAIYVLIIISALIVLTYEPTMVYDVLLISNDGRPISTQLKLFQSDDVLISGFFAALSTISTEFTKDKSSLTSVKRGDQEIIIEEGVLTKIIALVDKDRPSLRRTINNLYKPFEIKVTDILQNWNGVSFDEAASLIKQVGETKVTFSIDPQTKWMAVLTIIFAPLLIILLSLIN